MKERDEQSQERHNRPSTVAIVTQGYFTAGGVQAVARWLRDQLQTAHYDVTVFDIEASRTGKYGRSFAKPNTWFKSTRIQPSDREAGVYIVGAALAEVEFMRYKPNSRLDAMLNNYDLIQIVCGTPSIAYKVKNINPPAIIQMATLASWERESIINAASTMNKVRLKLMTSIVSAMELPALRSMQHILVENTQILNQLTKKGLTNVSFAPPGVNTALYRPPHCDRYVKTPARLIYIGRLGEPRKGIDRLVRAYQEAVLNDAEFPQLVLAGRGDLPSNIKNLIADPILATRIAVYRDISETQKIDLLQKSDIFIQTSFEEGLGVAVIEAMACGLPIIATETAGTLETVDSGVTGTLIPQTSVDGHQLAIAVADIMADYSAYSRAARNLAVKSFSNEATFSRFESTYMAARSKTVEQ